MKDAILKSVLDAVAAVEFLQDRSSVDFMDTVSDLIAAAFKNGRKVLIAGNGGSLCDAMHFAEELTGYFREKRPALPAIALSDPSHMSCVANDSHFDQVFARAVEALGKRGDVLVVLSTSGNSKNIVQAVMQAKDLGIKTVSFLGKNGGLLKGMCDLEWIIPSFKTSDRIQEAHMTAIHIIIEMIEKKIDFASLHREKHLKVHFN